MRDELALLDATAQAELVRAGQVTAVELTEAAIERIEALNPELNAVVTPAYEQALEAARTVRGGPFAGVPYLLKDLACEMAGVRFTEGSRFLADNVSTFDAELVVRLRNAGLIVLGKTNTPEFGMAPACEPALFGPTRNSWDTTRSTSGSCGGSAAAVASGMVPFAHGNDLGGSLRYPASACGLFALKPTRARNPLGPEYGDVAAGGAVEHALTRSVRDSAALLDAVHGADLGAPYHAPAPERSYLDEVSRPPGALRIALQTTAFNGAPTDPECAAAARDAAKLCQSLGHRVDEATVPVDREALGRATQVLIGANVLASCEDAAALQGRKLGPDLVEAVTWAIIESAGPATSADYARAVRTLHATTRAVEAFFQRFDVLLTPTMAMQPARVGELALSNTPGAAYGQRLARCVGYTSLFNSSGNPAMSVPLGTASDGMPLGVQFAARFGDEATLFRLAGQLERERPWAERRPRVAAVP